MCIYINLYVYSPLASLTHTHIQCVCVNAKTEIQRIDKELFKWGSVNWRGCLRGTIPVSSTHKLRQEHTAG